MKTKNTIIRNLLRVAAIQLAFVTLSAVVGWQPVTAQNDSFYVHSSTAGNTSSNCTYLDHPDLNGNPNAELIVSHNWNPGNVGGTYHDKAIGMYYNDTEEAWCLYNEDVSNMVADRHFNIYIARGAEVIEHEASAATIINGYITEIDHPKLNNNPEAHVTITKSYNGYNDHNYAAYYRTLSDKWAIFNEDVTEDIPLDRRFFVAVDGAGAVSYRHESTAASITGNSTVIDHPYLNNNPDAVFVFTHIWSNDNDVIMDKMLGVWYTGSNWAIYTEDLSAFPQDALFDLMIQDDYCGLAYSDVEPITNVEIAGLAKSSDATLGINPVQEYFLSELGYREAHMVPGQSYSIALEGNTGGAYENSFAVFVDWNQNGILDDAGEVYDIAETIESSTGEDGQQATAIIEVPENALSGTTRMRVKKMYTQNTEGPCITGTGYGQTEDYTVRVADPPVNPGSCQGGVTTFFNSNNGSAGNMFDVENTHTEEIIIESFDVNIVGSDDADISIYWKSGSYVGSEDEENDWTLLGQETVTPSGLDTPTPVDIGGVTIPAGFSVGLYITVSNYNVDDVSFEYTNGGFVISNGHLEITTGNGINSPDFTGGTVYTPRTWNGNIYYCDESISTNVPVELADFNYWPNPTADVLNISSEDTIDNAALYNLAGQKVLEQPVSETEAQLHLNHLPTGLYVMKITVGGQTGVYKVLKK